MSVAKVLAGEARWAVELGVCRDILSAMPEASVDAVVTDPPYELGFMGKAWDASGVAFDAATWRAVLRVLKPGGHLVAFGGTRGSHRMVSAIEDAGFAIRDSLVWLYGSGFPKSLDVSKALDAAAGATREVVGLKRLGGNAAVSLADKGGTYGVGVGTAPAIDVPITAPSTDAAKQWAGWGTALKPAHEPICLARKPLSGTVAANVQAHGTGALNVDGCRVDSGGTHGSARSAGQGRGFTDTEGHGVYRGVGGVVSEPHALGRWPANVLLDPEAAAMLDEQSGTLKSGALDRSKIVAPNLTFGASPKALTGTYSADTGGASRFFYTSKTSTEEREAGCSRLPRRAAHDLVDREEGAAALNSPRTGAGRSSKGRANHHPTVKPLDLMRWLCRLITPPGGIVLDPFTGSGSTGAAAMLEQLRFVGCELGPEYAEIARARIAYWDDVLESRQTTIFAIGAQ